MRTQDHLTTADVENLFSEPTEDVRMGIAQKVASQFSNSVLTKRERELAKEILGYLVLDVSAVVRRALATALCDLPHAPREIVLKLAHDLDDVAEPLLQKSSVFADDDLAELVQSGTPVRQCLIARRPDLGPSACGAIATSADRSAVLVLVTNNGVVIRPDVLETIVHRYADDEDILDPMTQRADVPMRMIERIVTMVSEQLRDQLVARHKIDPSTAKLLEDIARERSLVTLMNRATGDCLDRLLVSLMEADKLTPSLLLRAVCAGEMDFVVRGLAIMTSIQSERASRLIHDMGPLGFRALHARAGLPELFYPAFRGALDVLLQLEASGQVPEKSELKQMMMARIGPDYRDVRTPDLDLLIDRLVRASLAPDAGMKVA
ncbi:MAG: DUF2336 domain-containing protein [Parvibaculum sp.]|nr:DUF2336 domain-containing protein [Parvibaculum sp.]